MGTHKTARQMMHIIKWRSNPSPPETPNILDRWEDEWTAGFHEVPAKDVNKMRQRLMAYEEWENRRLIAKYRKVAHSIGDKLMEKVEAGESIQGESVAMRYATEPVNVLTLSTNNAFGTPKPTPTQIQQLNIVNNAPPRRLRAPKKVEQIIDTTAIDVTVKELTSGNSRST